MNPSFSKNFLTPEYNTIENTVPDLKRKFPFSKMWELLQIVDLPVKLCKMWVLSHKVKIRF
ncbi:hypothetical protein B2G50_08785 [Leptospira interrogans serovar Canicola]|nr:hypothetical protein B2G50_08785 [Leptospira interrogans serovar Canicola]